jgi:hypothetical protein
MIFRTILGVALAAAMLSGVVFMIFGSYHSIRAAYCLRSDAPFRWLVAINRFNAAWFPDQLNEVGLRHRSQVFKYQRRAIGCLTVMIGLALVLFFTR